MTVTMKPDNEEKGQMSGYLRLRVEELLEEYGDGMSLHKASQLGRFPYPTMWRYWRTPDELKSIHTRAVVGLLVDAIGLTPEEVEDLKFGDVFEIVIEESD